MKVVYCFDASPNFYLQKPQLEVQAWKIFSAYQTLQHLLNSLQGVGVPSSYGNSDGRSQCRSISLHPSFLTNTMALHHALWLGCIAPDYSISLRWLWTSSTKGRGICLNCSLKGVSSVTLIVCLVEWVQPNSAGSNEKTLWYLAKSQWADSANSGGHDPSPLRSSSSNSFPCLCWTVNLGAWGLWGLSCPSGNLVYVETHRKVWNILCLITEVKQSWALLIHGWVTVLPALLCSVIRD